MIGQIANTAFIGTPTGLSSHLELSNDSWTFGPQLLGQYGGSGRIYISNSGPADFRVQAIYIRDSSLSFSQSFMITGTSCGGIVNSPPRTLPPGDWCYVDFSFTPQSPGWQTAAMYIPEESLDSPHIIPLGGTGIGSTLQLSNTSWDFGAHSVGETTGDGVIYIYNRGPASIRLAPYFLFGPFDSDFHLTSYQCGDLPPYTTCALTFNFTPTGPGERTATLSLQDNSNYGPILIPIMGYAYTSSSNQQSRR